MKTIDDIKQDYKKHPNHYQPVFVLAYGHYLPKKDLYEVKMDTVLDGMSESDVNDFDNTILKYNEKNILKSLSISLGRAFNFALNKDAVNAALSYNEVKAWCYILDNKNFYNFKVYNNYGLPLFKAVAEHYGMNNQIGENTGKEQYYE